jgi:hypothetical protein
MIKTIEWNNGRVIMLVTAFTTRRIFREYTKAEEVAPRRRHGDPWSSAIGVAAAMGIALGMNRTAIRNFIFNARANGCKNETDSGKSILAIERMNQIRAVEGSTTRAVQSDS